MKPGPFEELENFLAESGTLSLATKHVLAAARRRAATAWEHATGADSRALAVAIYVTDVLSGVWLDREWDKDELKLLLERMAASGEVRVEPLTVYVTVRLLRDPALLQMPPMLAVEAALRRLVALGAVEGAALWTRIPGENPAPLMRAGEPIDDELGSSVAAGAIESDAVSPEERRRRGVGSAGLVVVPITRWLRPHAVLIASPLEGDVPAARLPVEEAAAILGPVLEREVLLRRNADKERAVVAASERRLERLGLDLHDRPIQDLAALAADLRLFRDQLADVLAPEPERRILSGRIDDLEARLVAVHTELRELSHSLASPVIFSCPLKELLAREASMFRRRTDIELHFDIGGDLDSLPVQQRMTVLRIVQEALSNAREHSGAGRVAVSVHALRGHVEARISDDGRGFEVDETLVRAGERGRLGLVGINERARLLGGSCEITSRPGGPTTIAVALPRIDVLDERERYELAAT